MKSREFFLDCDGMNVHAKLDFPKGGEEGRYPLLVIFHGFTGHMEEPHIIAAARTANEAGFASLRTEFYGHGQSEGDFKKHTILHWLTQAMRIIDYAHSLDFVSQIYLAGHSQGGLTAVLTAGMMPDRIRGLIPLSPAMLIPDGARLGHFLGFSFDPDSPPDEIVNEEGLILSSDYVRAARILPVERCIQYYHGPVCIIHGTEDETVPYHYAQELAEKYRNNGNDVQLVPIPGADHCYTHPGEMDEMAGALRRFLVQ